MKKFTLEFLKRGLMAAAGGPVILAIIYFCLGKSGAVESFSPDEVALGILSSVLMAYIAAGISAIYTLEQLPMISAALIHGGVLYLDYLLVYLLNDWIKRDFPTLAGFTLIFAAGYALIWVVIYAVTRNNTKKLNQKLRAGRE